MPVGSQVVEAYPDVLGLSIDENTAVAMVGDEIEVVGTGASPRDPQINVYQPGCLA